MQTVIVPRTSLRGLKAATTSGSVNAAQIQKMTAAAQIRFAPAQVDSICGASTESQSG